MFKKIAFSIVIYSIAALMNSAFASSDAIAEFEEAWKASAHTPYERPAQDINSLLKKQGKDLQLKGTHLWDAEVKKAWNPAIYIPHAVLKGETFDQATGPQGEVTFIRRSEQRSFLNLDNKVDVLEEVHIYENSRKIIFLGRDVTDPVNPKSQPLFHVEHSVGGTEENPTSLWRIVFLTPTHDQGILGKLEKLGTPEALPIFVQQYIKHDLKL